MKDSSHFATEIKTECFNYSTWCCHRNKLWNYQMFDFEVVCYPKVVIHKLYFLVWNNFRCTEELQKEYSMFPYPLYQVSSNANILQNHSTFIQTETLALFVVGVVVLYIVGCLAASLVSTHLTPTASSSKQWQSQMSPAIAELSQRDSWNHCPKSF